MDLMLALLVASRTMALSILTLVIYMLGVSPVSFLNSLMKCSMEREVLSASSLTIILLPMFFRI